MACGASCAGALANDTESEVSMQMDHESFNHKELKPEVMIVDDQEMNREILAMNIDEEFTPVMCKDGFEAIETLRARKRTISLVLLDLHMPGMSGQDVLRTLKADPELGKIPVIVMTGESDAEIESLELGASDFIPKPYPDRGVILARMRRLIELFEDRQIIQTTERDTLTSLFTREYFYRYAEHYDLRHPDLSMDAILFDVNHFHMINERFGNAYGDEVLRQIGAKISDLVSARGGLACRRGSDTFMLYIPHGTDFKEMFDAVSVSLMGEHSGSRVRLRMGVYEAVDRNIEIERRFDRAKIAADTVRNNFTNNIAFYDADLHKKELYEEQLIENFPRAISERQFKVFYQPKFDVWPDTPVLDSAEALVRWQHPTLGLISPGIFIPLFEENGLIQALDHYVWRTAAAQIKAWKDAYNFTLPVSVNVSRIDMYDPALIDTLIAILAENELSPSELHLEITESAYTQDSKQIVETVEKLRELGFKIEMDDFGTGYSSLNMISSLPIDVLKLDMLFIRTAFGKRKDTRMLQFIIDIGDYLGVPVIAEGVENEEQLNALKAMGCDIVQGYYFSKPVPAEEFARFIEARTAQGEVQTSGALAQTGARGGATPYFKITNALSSGFESVYYVDAESGSYVEFNSGGHYEDLQIQRSGNDFFADLAENCRRVVFGPDQDRVISALSREAILAEISTGGSISLTYRLVIDGLPVYYNTKVFRAGAHDEHHIVVGVSNVDEQIRQTWQIDEETTLTFNSLSKALCRDMESIYYIDLETESYMEFVANGDYRDLKLEITGENFFEEATKNIRSVLYVDDQERVTQAIQREALQRALADRPAYFIDYRVVLGGKLIYYRLKAIYADPADQRHIIIGVSNVHGQIAEALLREAEQSRALRMAREFANRDALTGVKTKHVFAGAEEQWNSRIASGERIAFAVVVCDVNGLKTVNDTLGHKAGDQLIKDAAALVCTIFKHSPVYRIGGDEFVAVLSGSDYDDRLDLIRILQEKVEQNVAAGGVVLASGMAEFDSWDKCFADVFNRADQVMYENKKMLKSVY
ncbi:MAG: EAL domain-containing protein [Desulfovibrio sp.]|nr:EAL domain-containing protein [Desulfovibrio sp.]